MASTQAGKQPFLLGGFELVFLLPATKHHVIATKMYMVKALQDTELIGCVSLLLSLSRDIDCRELVPVTAEAGDPGTGSFCAGAKARGRSLSPWT